MLPVPYCAAQLQRSVAAVAVLVVEGQLEQVERKLGGVFLGKTHRLEILCESLSGSENLLDCADPNVHPQILGLQVLEPSFGVRILTVVIRPRAVRIRSNSTIHSHEAAPLVDLGMRSDR